MQSFPSLTALPLSTNDKKRSFVNRDDDEINDSTSKKHAQNPLDIEQYKLFLHSYTSMLCQQHGSTNTTHSTDKLVRSRDGERRQTRFVADLRNDTIEVTLFVRPYDGGNWQQVKHSILNRFDQHSCHTGLSMFLEGL